MSRIQDWRPESWIPIKRIGSNEYFISQDGRFFFKHSAGQFAQLKQEYHNLNVLSHSETAIGLHFLRPIAVLPTLEVLVTEYVDGKLLADIRDSEIYYSFGQRLRAFHAAGHTHSHLQVNDIMYTNGVFVIADLAFMDEEPPVHDLALFKLSCQIFGMKRPWCRGIYKRCYAAFREGYGFCEDDTFQRRTEYLLKRWLMRLSTRSLQSKWLEATALRFAIAMRVVG